MKTQTCLNNSIYQKFQETVYSIYGIKKGVIQQAIEQAIKEWISKHV